MSGFIPPAFIREIVDITDIVALVDNYVPLKKKGNNNWALCPFCDDGKKPSFSVNSQKQFYYCFKCRATGNAISFLQSFEGLGFVESVEVLASRASIEVPYEQSSKKREDRAFQDFGAYPTANLLHVLPEICLSSLTYF